jgi:glycosyltransferase involved in cell wall biosynthesis
VLGVPLGDDLVFVCLARHDSQKNIAGTVASFLRVVAIMPRLRLVVAGDPSDFAELLRADGLRRSSRDGDRVHLLGNSDPGTLLAASDAFVLNSFFEGWPVAATEAAAAGLPLLLSDGGGARELVALDPRRSALIPNACGPASEVSDARVRAARRRARHQPNAADLVVAASAVAAAAAGGVRRRERGIPTEAAGQGAMVAAHARLLRSVTTPGDAEVTIG